ncbi:MAG: tyrosine-type recombinase/integrase [Candidatus Aureabacteria bacterium]|nr:tyrosine-type recombinase/integrase [Candidatus Auribacterota bacterium]
MSFPWALDKGKFLKPEEVIRLKEFCKKEMKIKKKLKIAIKNWFLIELFLNTGLRVQEATDLNCGDIYIQDNQSSILIRHGKGDKKRLIRINNKFRQDCEFYLRWKEKHNENTDNNAPLFANSKGEHFSKRNLQYMFKNITKKAGLPSHYSIHSLRHTYGSFLLRSSIGNLRLVQKQLGHSKVTTTEVYADVMDEELDKAIGNLYEDSY